MPENDALLEIRDLEVFFRVESGLLKAVNGFSLSIAAGTTVGLVGESGCGKSTLGKSVLRLHRPDGGKVLFKGRDIWELDRAQKKRFRKEVQMIFQDPYASLDPLCVVGDIVSEGMEIHGLYPGSVRRARVIYLLRMVGLNETHANRFPHEFSGGQRQRIGIARALAVEPELLVCDEPISALDVSIQAQIVNLIKRLQKQMNLSLLFITHDLSMVRHISDRIAVMYLGSLMELAPSDELYERSYHPYTEALLSAIPVADPEVERKRRRILLSGDVPSPIDLGEGCAFLKRCSYATELCRTRRPALEERGPGHFAACHNR
ncbi:MAG: ATP-binding cassette domain-containing protein [Spirochaetaceae bacterium]|nr:ATP-binding cassette domain-containing protein [Spirochaetaceae bacterium]